MLCETVGPPALAQGQGVPRVLCRCGDSDGCRSVRTSSCGASCPCALALGHGPSQAPNTGPSPVVNRPPYLTAGVRVCLQVRVEHYVNHENLSVCVCVGGISVLPEVS